MSDRSDERMIESLTKQSRRITRIPPLGLSLAGVLAAGSLVGAIALGPTAIHRGLAETLRSPGADSVVLIGLIVAALSGVMAALSEGEPGRRAFVRTGAIGLVGGLLLACTAATLVTLRAPYSATDEVECLLRCALYGAVPAALVLLLVSSGAPARARVAALAGGAGAVALGAALVHLACAGAGEPNPLLGQVLAPVLGALAALAFTRPLSSWRRRSGPGATPHDSTP